MGIDVESILADEGDQRLAAFLGEIDGETRRGGYGDDYGNSAGQGLLHDLEGGATADDKNLSIEGEQGIEQRMAEDLVNSVVTTDIFANNNGVTV